MAMSASWSEVKATGPMPSGGPHPGVWPLDVHNVKLLDNVHPRGWKNPQRPAGFVYDLVAIGAGAGGLVAAKQSARRGAKSALIEEHLAGGDCLNVGCVPSKALLRCARAAAERAHADLLGGVKRPREEAEADFAKVMERMRRLRAQIAPVDSHSSTTAAGADAFVGRGVFIGRNEIKVGEQTLRFKKAVICTGARAKVPPIPGLAEAPYLTNANIFNLERAPPRLAVIGAGPIGVELSQAFSRFGSQVTVLEGMNRIMGPEDPDAAAVIHQVLEQAGVKLMVGLKVDRVDFTAGEPWPEIRITVRRGEAAEPEVVVCDAFLVATGRAPNVDGLGLEVAGVEFTPGIGVKVNDDLSTSNPDIFAVGDVIHRPEFKFTHMAGTMAGMAVQNALFAKSPDLPVNAPSRVLSEICVPRCTYTEPEVASCGLSNTEAATRAGVEFDVYTSSLEHNDRGILEGDNPAGFVKILCKKGTEEILGATIVAERAGDMLAELTLAVQYKLGLSQIARTVHPYPTVGEMIQQAALNYNRARMEKLGS